MLCLSCGSEQPPEVAECSNCEAYLGLTSVGQGFLPQLSIIQEHIQAGLMSTAEAEERLLRLDDHLGSLIKQTVQLKAQMPKVIKDIPEATIGRVLGAVVEGLTNFRTAAADLELDGNWSDDDWANLKKAHYAWQNANMGMVALTQGVGRRIAAAAQTKDS